MLQKNIKTGTWHYLYVWWIFTQDWKLLQHLNHDSLWKTNYARFQNTSTETNINIDTNIHVHMQKII